MPSTHFATSSDLPPWAVALACAIAVASLVLLALELRKRERGGLLLGASGLFALGLMVLAVLRPVKIAARESVVGARVVVLADASRSMALKSDDGALRRDVRDRVVAALSKRAESARLVVLGFGDGAPRPLPASGDASAREPRSDLAAALRALAAGADERPAAVVVVSDGRLDDPPEGASEAQLRAIGDALGVPITTVATTHEAPADASVRRVAAAGAAVAHVPLPLRIEIGCAGGLTCGEVTVTARELREDGPPALLASGLAHFKDGAAVVDLTVTLERAGPRIVEVSIAAPQGDTIPENDRRLVSFDVARERVRVLHVAGRPTNDTRALREWLKSDASVDVVAFFILRTPSDNPGASQDDLALIPFPVDELFSKHLPSFDAVVLQDFDAQPYGLEQHLPALAKYVKAGGGLIMVGGQNSFVAGGYASTPLAEVLPVALDGSPGATAADTGPFVPQWTAQGKAAPLLAPLRAIVDDELPSMPGANVLGAVRPGGVVLWTHPSRTTPKGDPMPVLAIGDEQDGRAIALGVDGGWLLRFSQLGERTAGRGHGALWDGLLGWLMRDPRFEPAQMELVHGCTAGTPPVLRVHLLPLAPDAKAESVGIDVARIDDHSAPPIHLDRPRPTDGSPLDVTLPPLDAGGYAVKLRVGSGPATRRELACEAGGDEWADSRPDPSRLEALAKATGGSFAWAADAAASVPLPKPTVVSAERHVVPIAPAWVWTLLAAMAMGGHWLARRRVGLA
jgi:uncharacterized membrane protein